MQKGKRMSQVKPVHVPLPTVDRKATGVNILRLLYERGMTRIDLTRSLGISNTAQVSKYINGKFSPSLDNLVKIAYLLDVTLDDLVVIKKARMDEQ